MPITIPPKECVFNVQFGQIWLDTLFYISYITCTKNYLLTHVRDVWILKLG